MIKLLIVDDSALMRRQLTLLFQAEGDFTLLQARNGREAVAANREFQPDVITLDINMPEMDGITALSLLMAERPVPVVMVSSLTEKGALATFEALNLGAVDYITKPGGTISLSIDEIKEDLVGKVRSPMTRRIRDMDFSRTRDGQSRKMMPGRARVTLGKAKLASISCGQSVTSSPPMGTRPRIRRRPAQCCTSTRLALGSSNSSRSGQFSMIAVPWSPRTRIPWSRVNLDHIAHGKGRFITVLPGNRKEDAWFRKHIQDHDLPWEEVINRPNPRGADRLEDVWRVVVAPNRSAEGYRIVWVWSQLMAQRNEQSRLATLQKAFDGIQELNDKLQGPHNRLRDRVAVEEAVERILANGGASRWAGVEVTEGVDSRFKQERRGRPGAGTRYVKVERSRFTVAWKPKADVIAYDARSDGMYPLITNCDDLPAGDVLQKYKYQPNLEKRHEQLKTVYAVAPAFLKDEGRIEALLLLYFVALLVQALIERQVRTSMKAEKLRVLPLYPEDRECQAPTANRILEVFENLQRHDLMEGATLRKCFEPKLTPLQEDLLRLLGAPRNTYGLATPGMDS
jgi:CheY-like chemotaxis protein